MDIDKMFKMPKLPTGGNKRKIPNAPTPEMLKRMRMEAEEAEEPSQPAEDAPKQRKAYIVSEEEDEDMSVDTSDFAPGGDADYFAEEDEEGRFYGGGLTAEQKEILNIFDSVTGEGAQDDPDFLSLPSIRKVLLRFDRAVKKNQEQRSKYPDDPSKFIDSEADLDVAIKTLLPLSQAPSLAYPEMVRFGTTETLVGLLSHENTDIVIDVVEVVHELTDEDVGDEDLDVDEDDENKEAPLKTLIDGLQAYSILELLVDNLGRFKEEEDVDRQGLFHVLGIFENIIGFNPQLSSHLVDKTALMKWLLSRIQAKTHDGNRGYVAELLVILLQNNRHNRAKFAAADGIEILLTVAAQFRKRNPADLDEMEFMENVFDALCSAVSEPTLKELFLKSEGVDLMVLMMKEKKDARSRAIKVLDHAMSGHAGTASCETFIEAQGLKTLFAALMGKTGKKAKVASAPGGEETVHILGIVASLLTNVPSDTPARIRVLAKFVEGTYEKVDKLLEIREGAQARLTVIDKEIAAEKQELIAEGEEIDDDANDAWYLRRLDNGLFNLQTVDYIMAFLAMEDDGLRAHITQMLKRKNKSLTDLVTTLRIYQENVDEDQEQLPEGAIPRKEVLQALIEFIEGC